MTVILCFGDSVTQGFWDSQGGWVERLKRKLQPQPSVDFFSIFNLGISGDRSVDVLERFEAEYAARVKELDEGEQVITIFFVGANDAAYLHTRNTTWTAIEEYEQALQELVTAAKERATRVIVCGVLPCDDKKTDPVPWTLPSGERISYRAEVAKRFDGVARTIAQDKLVEFVDIQSLFPIGSGGEAFFRDGAHPNDEGHQRIADAISAEIRKARKV